LWSSVRGGEEVVAGDGPGQRGHDGRRLLGIRLVNAV
jgi:hypothetical protein